MIKTLRRLFRRQKSILLGPQTLPSTEAVTSDCVLILLCPAIQNMFEFWIMFVITTDLCFAHRTSEKKLNYNILSIGQRTCVRVGFFYAKWSLHMLDLLEGKLWWCCGNSFCPLTKVDQKTPQECCRHLCVKSLLSSIHLCVFGSEIIFQLYRGAQTLGSQSILQI